MYNKSKHRGHENKTKGNVLPNLPILYTECSDASASYNNDSDDENKSAVSSDFSNSDENEDSKPGKSMMFLDTGNSDSDADRPQFQNFSTNNIIKNELSKKKRKNMMNDNGCEPERKKKKKENKEESAAVISSTAQNMMKKLGYRVGEGLGKHSQGIVAPITVSKQKGRRGLGLLLADVDRDLINYNSSTEIYAVHEEVVWLDGDVGLKSFHELKTWIKIGKKKKTLDDEIHFVDPNILKNVLICKSAFDKMSGEEMRRARSRSNPYELIKKGPFLNRAAMKMANMDCVFDYMFTKPVDEFQNSLIEEHDLLYFADVCAGPGGFSEYVLSKKKWAAKGFGFTLKGDNDFKLADFYAGPCESFEPYYGECGDGDVYKKQNITSFTNYVIENTNNKGVHFMMADGGFCVEGQENIQEILSKRIYLCQCLVALSIVRNNGHFVCKLFDIFTPFSVGIIFLMYHCFEKISIHKPNTSRPANSERYIICKWKRDNVEKIKEYLFYLNEQLNLYGEASDDDIIEIVPLDMMKEDLEFYHYILNSNNSLGKRQINSLAKILEFSEDETLVEENQQILKKECMEFWRIPIKARRGPSNDHPDTVSRNLLENDVSFLRETPKKLLAETMNEDLYTIYDFYAVILGLKTTITSKQTATFFLGVAHRKIYKLERSTAKWTQVLDINLELSPNTLVYGEIVPELIGEMQGQRKINVFHIIDGHTLGGKNISEYHYTERISQCALYAKSLTRSSMYTVVPIKIKQIFELEKLYDYGILSMKYISMKNNKRELVLPAEDSVLGNQYFIPNGILFVKATRAPYRKFFSKTQNQKYYWAPTKEPLFDQHRPAESVANFKKSYETSLVWHFNEDENPDANNQTFMEKLIKFIENNKYTKRIEKRKDAVF